jgi:hypothetical protein
LLFIGGTVTTLPVRYKMLNRVNGDPITLTGEGSLSDQGILDLNIEISKIPPNWNSVLVPCICSGPGPGPDRPGPARRSSGGLISYASRGYKTTPGTYRVADLYNSAGEKIAAIRATGVYAKNETGLDFDIDVDTWTLPGSILSKLSKIDHYSFTIEPRSKGKVAVFSHYTLSTPDNEKVSGCTKINYDLLGDGESLENPIFGVNRIETNVEGNRFHYRSAQQAFDVGQFGTEAVRK